MKHIELDDEIADLPFTPDVFAQLVAARGDTVVWDTVFAMGFGQEDFEQGVHPDITNRVLVDAVEKEADARGVTEAPLTAGATVTDVQVPQEPKPRRAAPARVNEQRRRQDLGDTVRANFIAGA